MGPEPSPIERFRAAQANREFDSIASLRKTLGRANGNASRNTYISFDPVAVVTEGKRQLEHLWARKVALISTGFPSLVSASLPDALPVSLKDCFDLAGYHTSAGSRFYASTLPPAKKDSALAARIKKAGGVITGKTHMHQLAYGITGQNRDYGDCLQPDRPDLLTGGSSSGAAASVQEGSALAAIGTDTGGSIRLPAAICGLSGYRASCGIGDWKGAMHLAPPFDTMGWIFRDLRDAPLLAESIFDLPRGFPGDFPGDLRNKLEGIGPAVTVGVLEGPLVEPCEEAVVRSMDEWQERLLRAGAKCEFISPKFWLNAWDIYAPIQAAEAAKIHKGHFREFEPEIAERLKWGAGIKALELRSRQKQLAAFRAEMEALFHRYDFILAPTTPVASLPADQPQHEARPRILKLTTPASLAGLPAVVLPAPAPPPDGCGLQLLAQRNHDRVLLRFVARLGEQQAWEMARS